MKQIDLNGANVFSPFGSEEVAFSIVGVEEQEAVSKLLAVEKSLLRGKESLKWLEEFARGRLAARNALSEVNAPNEFPILRGESGEPLWPVGYIGSISHSGRIGVACAARTESYLGLGIDLENYEKKRQPGIFKKIATEKELSWIQEDQQEIQKRGVLIFSIKESIYKAVYQAFKIRLAYMDAEVSPNLEKGQATVEILKDNFSKAKITAGFNFSGEYVLSGVGVLSTK